MQISITCLYIVFLLVVCLRDVSCKPVLGLPPKRLRAPTFESKHFISIRGGSIESNINSMPKEACSNPNPLLIKSGRQVMYRNALATWGIFQVITMLSQSIYRLYPIAAQPFHDNSLSHTQWTAYAFWVLIMLYSEGYKGFHQKYSPLVVRRAFSISDRANPFNLILSGPFSMGLFDATRKRLIVSWAMVVGIVLMVVLVRKLPYPYRAIIDGGVVAGLTAGAASVIVLYVRALLGHLPEVDPCLNEVSKDK